MRSEYSSLNIPFEFRITFVKIWPTGKETTVLEQQALFKPGNHGDRVSFFVLPHFRRALNFQCLKLVVRNFNPFGKF